MMERGSNFPFKFATIIIPDAEPQTAMWREDQEYQSIWATVWNIHLREEQLERGREASYILKKNDLMWLRTSDPMLVSHINKNDDVDLTEAKADKELAAVEDDETKTNAEISGNATW